MKLSKMLLAAILLAGLAVTLTACSPREPAINRIVENPAQLDQQTRAEITRYEFVAYIPLRNPDDVEALVRDVNQWIKEHKDQYDIISVDVINATKIGTDASWTMPSGAMIVYLPKKN